MTSMTAPSLSLRMIAGPARTSVAAPKPAAGQLWQAVPAPCDWHAHPACDDTASPVARALVWSLMLAGSWTTIAAAGMLIGRLF